MDPALPSMPPLVYLEQSAIRGGVSPGKSLTHGFVFSPAVAGVFDKPILLSTKFEAPSSK